MESSSSEIRRLLEENESLSRCRVSLEMRAVELEEQRDKMEEDNREMERRTKEVEQRMKSHARPMLEMESELSVLRAEVSRLREEEESHSESVRAGEKELVEKCERLEQQEVQVREMEKMLLAKNVELAESLAKTKVRLSLLL